MGFTVGLSVLRSLGLWSGFWGLGSTPEGPYTLPLWFWEPNSIIGVHMDPLGNMDFKVGFWRSLLTVLGLWSRFSGFGTVLGSVCTD